MNQSEAHLHSGRSVHFRPSRSSVSVAHRILWAGWAATSCGSS